jgi:hypothetical protein
MSTTEDQPAGPETHPITITGKIDETCAWLAERGYAAVLVKGSFEEWHPPGVAEGVLIPGYSGMKVVGEVGLLIRRYDEPMEPPMMAVVGDVLVAYAPNSIWKGGPPHVQRYFTRTTVIIERPAPKETP